MRNALTLVLVVAAFAAGYWMSRPREPDYAWENGRLVRIDPNGSRTPLTLPVSAKDDAPDEEPTPAAEPAAPAAPQPEVSHDAPPVSSPPASGLLLQLAPQKQTTQDAPAPPVVPAASDSRPPPRVAMVTPQQPAPAPTATNYRTYPNLDLEGGDLNVLKQTDLTQCVAACRANSSCRAYSFDKWNRFCFLKAEVRALRLNPRSVTGVPETTPEPPRATTAEIMERYRGKAFRGAGYRSFRAQYEPCEAACKNERNCIAFTFQKNDNLCRLFDTTEEYFPNEFADSGGKRQKQ